MSDTLTYAALDLPTDYDERLAEVEAQVANMSDYETAEWILYLLTLPRVTG